VCRTQAAELRDTRLESQNAGALTRLRRWVLSTQVFSVMKQPLSTIRHTRMWLVKDHGVGEASALHKRPQSPVIRAPQEVWWLSVLDTVEMPRERLVRVVGWCVHCAVKNDYK